MDDHRSRRSCRPLLVAIAAVLVALASRAGGGCARAAADNRSGERRGARAEPALRAAPVRRAGRDGVRRDPRLRRAAHGVSTPARSSSRSETRGSDRRSTGGSPAVPTPRRGGWSRPTAIPCPGAFVFHVGAPGANPAGIAAQVLEGGTPRRSRCLFSVVRALDFLLLLAGRRRDAHAARRPRQPHARATRSRLSQLLAGAALLLALVAAAGIVLQGAAAGGSASERRCTGTSSRPCSDTRFGTVWLVQAGLAAACAARAPRRACACRTSADVALLRSPPLLVRHPRSPGTRASPAAFAVRR